MKTCCIISRSAHLLPFGYNEEETQCRKLKSSLEDCFRTLYQTQGITHFLCDMSAGVPLYAAEILLALKQTLPGLTLECVIPFETQAQTWSEDLRDRYFDAIARCDRETMMQKQFTDGCQQACLRQMIDRADTVLAVFPDETLLRYAQGQNKTIVHIDA